MNTIQSGPPARPWWKSGWFVAIVIIVALQLTGMRVPVQAALQRVILATGLMRPDLDPVSERPVADLNLQLIDSDDRPVALSTFRGDVLFVNFWATWCAPCVAEMPSIDAVHRDRGDDVRFFLVATDDEFERSRTFMQSRGYTLPLYRLASGVTPTFASRTIPTTWVIDRSGRVAVRESGMAAYDTGRFRAILDQLISER